MKKFPAYPYDPTKDSRPPRNDAPSFSPSLDHRQQSPRHHYTNPPFQVSPDPHVISAPHHTYVPADASQPPSVLPPLPSWLPSSQRTHPHPQHTHNTSHHHHHYQQPPQFQPQQHHNLHHTSHQQHQRALPPQYPSSYQQPLPHPYSSHPYNSTHPPSSSSPIYQHHSSPSPVSRFPPTDKPSPGCNTSIPVSGLLSSEANLFHSLPPPPPPPSYTNSSSHAVNSLCINQHPPGGSFSSRYPNHSTNSKPPPPSQNSSSYTDPTFIKPESTSGHANSNYGSFPEPGASQNYIPQHPISRSSTSSATSASSHSGSISSTCSSSISGVSSLQKYSCAQQSTLLSLPDNIKNFIFEALLMPYTIPGQEVYLDPDYLYQTDLINLSSTCSYLRKSICTQLWSNIAIYSSNLDLSFLEPPLDNLRIPSIENAQMSKQRLAKLGKNKYCLLLSSHKFKNNTQMPFPISILQYTKTLSFDSDLSLTFITNQCVISTQEIYKIINLPMIAPTRLRMVLHQYNQSTVLKYIEDVLPSQPALRLSLHIPDSQAIRQISHSPVLVERLVSISLLGTKFHFDKASCRALEVLHALEFLHLPIDTKLISNDRDQFNRKTRDLLINHFNKLVSLREIKIYSEDMSIPLNRQWLPKTVDTLTINVLSLRKTPHIKEDLFDGVKHLTIICSPNRKPPVVPFPFRNIESLSVNRAENQSGSIKSCYDAIRTLIHTNTRISKLKCHYVHPMDMSVIISGSRNSVFQTIVDEISLDSHIRFRLSRLADPFYQPGSYNDDEESRVTDSDSDTDAMNGILWFLNVDSLSGILQELYNFSRLKRVRLPVLESCIHFMDIVMLAKRNPTIESLVLVYRTQNYENYVSSRRLDMSYVNKFFFEKTPDDDSINSDSLAGPSNSGGVLVSTSSSVALSIDAKKNFNAGNSDTVTLGDGTATTNASSFPATALLVGPHGNPQQKGHSNSSALHFESSRSSVMLTSHPNFSLIHDNSISAETSSVYPVSVDSESLRRASNTLKAPVDMSRLFVLLNPEDRVCTVDEFKPVDHVAYFYSDLSLWRELV